MRFNVYRYDTEHIFPEQVAVGVEADSFQEVCDKFHLTEDNDYDSSSLRLHCTNEEKEVWTINKIEGL